jgi:hypothetical protein
MYSKGTGIQGKNVNLHGYTLMIIYDHVLTLPTLSLLFFHYGFDIKKIYVAVP